MVMWSVRSEVMKSCKLRISSCLFLLLISLILSACVIEKQKAKPTSEPPSTLYEKKQLNNKEAQKMRDENQDNAILGGGCFWCVEAVFQKLKGVESVVSGYAGGTVSNPTYKEICSGTTGHAEVVKITFDRRKISYTDLLDVFWHTHNPTTLNRQGADVGTQYRSVIFYHDEEQRLKSIQSKKQTEESGLWPDPIVTEISPAPTFYPAESYHQNYYRSNPSQPYCVVVISPKLKKLQSVFQDRLKD